MINFLLLIFGVLLLVLGIILLLSSLSRGGKIRGGGIVLIGPFPILFGEKTPTLIAVLLLALFLSVFLILFTGVMVGGAR